MFPRITSKPGVLGGKPCIKDTRISVAFILELLASGGTRDDIIAAYPQLTADDVTEAVQYAAKFLENDIHIAVELHS